MEDKVSRWGKSIICSKKMMFKEKYLNTDRNYHLCNTNSEILPSSAGSVCLSRHPEPPNPAHHGEHEFQSISISEAGISQEYESRLVSSRWSTALTGLLQPGLTGSGGTGASLTKWHFPLEKRCGNFSIKGGSTNSPRTGWAGPQEWVGPSEVPSNPNYSMVSRRQQHWVCQGSLFFCSHVFFGTTAHHTKQLCRYSVG